MEKVTALNLKGLKNKQKAESKKTTQTKDKNWENCVEHPDTKYVLLTLAEEFVDKKTILDLGWKIVTYAEYANILRNGVKHISNSFHRELIERYCDFIETFAQHTNACLEKIKDTDGWDILNKKDYKEVRCNDIWQKVVMHKLAQKLTALTKKHFSKMQIKYDDKDSWDQSKRPLMIRVAYFHGQALLELKHLLANGVVFCVQQQGDNNLSIGIVVKPGEAIEKALRKKDKDKWHESIKRLISAKHLEHIIPGNEFYSFQSEGACGFYYIKSPNKFNIIDTLNYMIELMGKAISTTNSLTL